VIGVNDLLNSRIPEEEEEEFLAEPGRFLG